MLADRILGIRRAGRTTYLTRLERGSLPHAVGARQLRGAESQVRNELGASIALGALAVVCTPVRTVTATGAVHRAIGWPVEVPCGNGDPDSISPAVDASLFTETAEKDLAKKLAGAARKTQPLAATGKYTEVLKELSKLRCTVDTYFDKVMVMVEDNMLRTARLQLLAQIRHEFRQVADISRLQMSP